MQNAVLVALLLALGSQLCSGRRARFIELAVFLCFSGMDAIGNLLQQGKLADHMEQWAGNPIFLNHHPAFLSAAARPFRVGGRDGLTCFGATEKPNFQTAS